jgi:hypothetical protein
MQQRIGVVPDGKAPIATPNAHGKDQGRPVTVSEVIH